MCVRVCRSSFENDLIPLSLNLTSGIDQVPYASSARFTNVSRTRYVFLVSVTGSLEGVLSRAILRDSLLLSSSLTNANQPRLNLSRTNRFHSLPQSRHCGDTDVAKFDNSQDVYPHTVEDDGDGDEISTFDPEQFHSSRS